MNTRREFLTTAYAAGAAARLPGAQKKQPNILFLFTDDQRFNTICALGNDEIHTPNIDRLVRRGVSFTHACIQGGTVPAVCMPSRGQVNTGRSLFAVHHGMVLRGNDPDPPFITFGERLREAGYSTFATGKWHNGTKLFHRTFTGGANIFFGGMSDHSKVPVFDFDSTGQYRKENLKTVGFSSQVFADGAVRFLHHHDRSKPFLMYTAFTSPHDPRMAPQRFADLYDPAKLRLPGNFLPRHPFDNGELKVRDELLAAFPRTPEEVRRHLAAYYAMVSEVDWNIGRVLDALDASGEAANTYVIFAADNGLAVGSHGLMGKQNLYDHSMRVPMVINGPGVPADRRLNGLCYLMDLCPTICDLAGAPVPNSLDGHSLRPALTRQDTHLRPSVIAAYRNVQRAIRTDRWKLIVYNVAGRKTTQLFDLEKDPLEKDNLAESGSHSRTVHDLKSELQKQLKSNGDSTDLGSAVWGP